MIYLLDRLPRVRTHPIHLIDEANPRYIISAHLPIDSDGLRLNSRYSTKDHDGAIQHPQCPLDLNCEVDMSRRINQIDVVLMVDAVLLLDPIAEGRSRLDSDAFLPLQIHRVHLCANRILAADFVDPLDAACVEKNSFRACRFARINMRLFCIDVQQE